MPHKNHKGGWPKEKPRSATNIHNLKKGWIKRKEKMAWAKQQAALEQAFFLLNATKDDYETLVKLEPQA